MLLYGNTRLLVAEDHEMFRSVLARYCETWGYTVAASCADGRTALVEALRLKPDLALLDIDMPHYSGLQVAAAIKQKLPSMKLIMVTSEPHADHIRTARRIGVDGFLDKTTDTFEKIAEAIASCLSGKRYHSPSVALVLASDPVLARQGLACR